MTKKEKLNLIGGSTITLRDGEVVVDFKPLSTLLSYYLLDECTDTTESGTKFKMFSQMLYTCAFGITKLTINGKTIPMETKKIFGKTFYYVRLEEFDALYQNEISDIFTAINEASKLPEEAKNASVPQ